MPHIEIPIQAGDDEVLVNMKRGYTQQDYRDIIAKIRNKLPDCSIATDIIVGFPGETEEQFMQTHRLLSDLKLDVAHLARYSFERVPLRHAAWMMMCPKQKKCAACICWMTCKSRSLARSTKNISAKLWKFYSKIK